MWRLNLHVGMSRMWMQIERKRQRWHAVFEQYNWAIFLLFCACSLIYLNAFNLKNDVLFAFSASSDLATSHRYVMKGRLFSSAQWMNDFALFLCHDQKASVSSLACLFPDTVMLAKRDTVPLFNFLELFFSFTLHF